MTMCPTCGRPLKKILSSDELLEILMHGAPHREVYRAQTGGWYVTHGGGETSLAAVQTLIAQGAIQSVYDNCPNDAFHVGKTLAIEATIEEREKRRAKDALLVYTDGSREHRS